MFQQGFVESSGCGKALKTPKSSTAAEEASSHDDSLYNWTPTSEAERVELPQFNGLSTLKIFPHRFMYVTLIQVMFPHHCYMPASPGLPTTDISSSWKNSTCKLFVAS